MSATTSPRFLDAGDGGLVVEFGTEINEVTNRDVTGLAAQLSASKIEGILELVPTYRSLLIQFDPRVVFKSSLTQAIRAILSAPLTTNKNASLWHIPVCYGGEHGADLPFVAQTHGLDEAEVVARHVAVTYRVYMIGFAPGFTYLGGLDPTLHTSRRNEPRLKTPPRSISIGGMQTAVSPPLEIPSGWHFIGRTAVRTYDPTRKGGSFLLEPGDYLRFHAIDPRMYERQLNAAVEGDLIAEREDYYG